MDPLWTLYIEPFLRALRPGRILELGAGRGEISLPLVEFCREAGRRVEIVDPAAPAELRARLEGSAEACRLLAAPAAKGVRAAEHPDVVLLGGEPNWSSVHDGLMLLRRLSAERSQDFPSVIARNTGWPYGRRDMYAHPDYVQEKHAYAHQGVEPGEPGLTELGLNADRAHAAHEGGPRNGVLTALEDFVSTTPIEMDVRTLPVFGGLTLLVPASKMTPELKAMLDGFFSDEGLTTVCQALEAQRIETEVELARTRARLERRTQALGRARELLVQKQAEIAALNERLAAQTAKA